MASRPSAHRQVETAFPTPLVGDVLFSERTVCQSRRVPEYGTPHPNRERWPHHVLVFAKERGEPDSHDVFDFFYAAKRENQDLYNFEKTSLSVGNLSLTAVNRSYVILRSEYDPNDPAKGSAMPDVPEGKFEAGFVMFQSIQQRTGERELDSLFVVEQRTYLLRYSGKAYDYDDTFGQNLYMEQFLVHADENVPGVSPAITAENLFDDPANAAWGLQSDGRSREGRRINDEWYVVMVRDVVPPDIAENGRAYTTTVDFAWPAVLGGVTTETWPLRDGGQEVYPRVVMAREAYRGPVKASIVQQFSNLPIATDVPYVMQPRIVQVSCPFFSLNTGPVLHSGVEFIASPGTEHPRYDYSGGTWTFAATVPEDWPSSLLASDECRPFRGGFLRETVTVFRP